jgi:hypothetical protein
VLAQRFHDRHAGRFASADGGGDRGRNEAGIADRRELDEPGAITEAVANRPRRPDREPGLAGPAGSGQGDEAASLQEVNDLRDLAIATDERRHRLGQVRRQVGGAKRPVVVGDARDDEPVHPPRLIEVLQAVEALVHERSVECRRSEPPRRRVRHDDLAAVPGGGQPRRVMDVQSDVVQAARRHHARAGMQADADADRVAVDGPQSHRRTAQLDRRDHRRLRLVEDGEHPVALVLDDDPARGGHGGGRGLIVFEQEGRPGFGAEFAGEPRRSLDVAEQEGDVTDGEAHIRYLRIWIDALPSAYPTTWETAP